MRTRINTLLESTEQILTAAAERGRDKLIALRRERVKTARDENGGTYGQYQHSQKARRKKEGLQTQKKDFGFYGTLFDNFKEIDRSITKQRAEIRISFEGEHKRRPDQTSASNLQVAEWLTDQTGRTIIGLSEKERQQIMDAIKTGVMEGIYGSIGKITIT
jgi:hypothetical protein